MVRAIRAWSHRCLAPAALNVTCASPFSKPVTSPWLSGSFAHGRYAVRPVMPRFRIRCSFYSPHLQARFRLMPAWRRHALSIPKSIRARHGNSKRIGASSQPFQNNRWMRASFHPSAVNPTSRFTTRLGIMSGHATIYKNTPGIVLIGMRCQ